MFCFELKIKKKINLFPVNEIIFRFTFISFSIQNN